MDETKETSGERFPGGSCPVCLASVICAADVEEAEVVACPDCQSALVVESVHDGRVRLDQAPRVEEDWGQ